MENARPNRLRRLIIILIILVIASIISALFGIELTTVLGAVQSVGSFVYLTNATHSVIF